MENGKKATFYQKLRMFFIGFMCVVAFLAFILSWYVAKNQMETNARVDTVVEYVRTKQPNFVSFEKTQLEIDSLTRLLEFKSVKEDYYIQQLSAQSTWIGMLITMLFVIFTLVEYTVFERKMENTQERYAEYRTESKEKILHVESEFNALKESLHKTNETFKKEVQLNFEKLAKDYSQKYKELRTGLYVQTSNLSFFASKNCYENKQYAECLYMTSEGLKFQIQLIGDPDTVQSRPELIQVSKNNLETALNCLAQIIQNKELKSALKNAPFFNFASENFIEINGFNHPELRDQVIDILGLLKMVSDESKDAESTKNDE